MNPPALPSTRVTTWLIQLSGDSADGVPLLETLQTAVGGRTTVARVRLRQVPNENGRLTPATTITTSSHGVLERHLQLHWRRFVRMVRLTLSMLSFLQMWTPLMVPGRANGGRAAFGRDDDSWSDREIRTSKRRCTGSAGRARGSSSDGSFRRRPQCGHIALGFITTSVHEVQGAQFRELPTIASPSTSWWYIEQTQSN